LCVFVDGYRGIYEWTQIDSEIERERKKWVCAIFSSSLFMHFYTYTYTSREGESRRRRNKTRREGGRGGWGGRERNGERERNIDTAFGIWSVIQS